MNKYSINQPSGIGFLFTTEMWERFGFWATQTLLVLFMTKAFLFSDDKAYSIYGAFGALLFITPIIGGYIADRFIGYQQAVIIGGILLILGYFSLAIAGNKVFYLALALLICGNGFLKPNISTLLGTLYGENDSRRDRGFTLFYLGINLGSLLGITICGYINKYFGWYSSFAASGIAITLGVIIFIIGFKKNVNLQKIASKCSFKQALLILLGTLITLGITTKLLTLPKAVNILLSVIGAVLTIAIIAYALSLDKAVRNKLLVCIILIIFSIAFWALYMQSTTSLTLFIERDVNPKILGLTLPTSVFFSFVSIFIIILTPVFISLWGYLNKIRKEPSTPMKFFIGVFLISMGYFVLTIAAKEVTATHAASGWWIVLCYLLQTSGELALSPIGLSMITLLSPKEIQGTMMGIWFFALAAAISIASSIAKLASVPASITDSLTTAHIYEHAFELYATAGLIISIILLLLTPLLKRMLGNMPNSAKVNTPKDILN